MKLLWRTYTITSRKFFADNGILHASALTFYTLFAVVPIVATAFGVAKGFGLEKFLNEQLQKNFPGQETVIELISNYAQTLLEQSKGGLIAGIGLLVLFYSVYRMLNHIEKAFNSVWQVDTPRSINTRISRYLSLILIGPVIFVSSSSLKLFIGEQIREFNILLAWGSTALSLLLVVCFFTWVYQYVPNIKVRARDALYGGTHAGIAYLVVQTLLVKFQMIFSGYGAVYGSLAALPIFLIWVQISWIIVLYGAQLCFVRNNNLRGFWEVDVENLSPDIKEALLIKLTHLCIEQFKAGRPPLTIRDLGKELKLANCCVRQLVSTLTNANVLVQTKEIKGANSGYQPAKSIEQLGDSAIILAVRDRGFRKIHKVTMKAISPYLPK